MTLVRWLRSALAPRPASRLRPFARRLTVESLEDRLTPSTGGLLDPTFGSGGQVLSPISNGAVSVVAQSDGKIVMAADHGSPGDRTKTGRDFLVARYNVDGSLDTSFGSGGYTITDFGSIYDAAQAVALQPQATGPSKILVVGLTDVVGHKGALIGEVALARYNANGTLDTTFGTNGKVITGLSRGFQYVSSVAVDSSGRIVVAGETGSPTLLRYTPNGALDTSFGTGGVVITTLGGVNINEAAVVQPDGKIVLACDPFDPATNTREFSVARFNVNGTADSTFGSGGVVTTSFGVGDDGWGGVTLQGDGKIVVSGTAGNSPSTSALYLLRYNTDGSLDTTFGAGGTVAVQSPGGQYYGGISDNYAVAVQADGKLVTEALLVDTAGQHEFFAALRVNSNGSVDTGYGNGGWATSVLPTGSDDVRAMALEPDGRLVLAGTTGEVALVRFLGSAPQVGSFTASPNPVTSGSSLTLTASNITDGNPNSTVTQVAFYYIDGTGTQQVLGYGTSDGHGNWTLTYTVGLPAGTYTLYAQATDNYGALGDPLALTLQVM
jgi:uncharacterized delta-60 repeat protein